MSVGEERVGKVKDENCSTEFHSFVLQTVNITLWLFVTAT